MQVIFNKYSILSIIILLYIMWGGLIFPAIVSNNWLYTISGATFDTSENILLFIFNVSMAIISCIIGLFILRKLLPQKKAILFLYFYTMIPAFLNYIKYVDSNESGWKIMPLISASMFYSDTYHFVLNISFLLAIIIFSVLNQSFFIKNNKNPSAKEVFILLFYFIFVWKLPHLFNI